MELSCPAPKHCEYGRKMASAASEAHETPRLSATFSSHDPFKTARLNQAGRKNKLRHSCGVTATLATKNHKTLYSLLRDQEVACSQTPRSCKLWWPGPGGPVPVAQSRWPSPVAGPGGLSRWPGPVPVARSRWPGPGGPVPVARSRWPGPGPALRARARGPAQKKTYSDMKNKRLLKHSFTCITVLIPPPEQTGELAKVCLTSGVPFFGMVLNVLTLRDQDIAQGRCSCSC